MFWIPMAISMGASLLGGITQSKGVDIQARAQKAAAEFNAAELEREAFFSEQQGRDALDRGEKDRFAFMRQFDQEQGERAAAMGASGIAMDSGSSLDVLSDSAAEAALDAATIRDNARREKAGYDEQARSSRARAGLELQQAGYAMQAARIQKQAILLNAVGSMAGSMAGMGFGSGSGGSGGGSVDKFATAKGNKK